MYRFARLSLAERRLKRGDCVIADERQCVQRSNAVGSNRHQAPRSSQIFVDESQPATNDEATLRATSIRSRVMPFSANACSTIHKIKVLGVGAEVAGIADHLGARGAELHRGGRFRRGSTSITHSGVWRAE